MRLLLCNDHGMFFEALTVALAAYGHEVVATTSDPAAVAGLVEKSRPDMCLIDSDVGPVSGLDIAHEIRLAEPGKLIVLLTASGVHAAREACGADAVDCVVSKLGDLTALAGAIAQVAGGEKVTRGWERPAPRPRREVMVDPLTRRELEVLQLVVDGASTETMVEVLGLSPHTVRTYVQGVLRKLGVKGRAQAAYVALQQGLVVPSGLPVRA